jgi:hypothetical protein
MAQKTKKKSDGTVNCLNLIIEGIEEIGIR